MVHRCCVSSCGMSVRVIGAKGLSYHSFPTKEPSREKWLQTILPYVEKPDLFRIVKGYTRVCSRHFKKKDYSIDSKKRARLNSNAVPSVFPGRDIKDSSSSSLVAESSQRKEHKKSTTTLGGYSIIHQQPAKSHKDPTSYNFSKLKITPIKVSDPIPGILDSRIVVREEQPHFPSEDDTASSAFSSQEECNLSTPLSHVTKQSGKIRKRRKQRTSLSQHSTSRKRSSLSEDVGVEGSEAVVSEMNVSTLVGSFEVNSACRITLTSDSASTGIHEMPPPRPPPILQQPNSHYATTQEDDYISASLNSVSLGRDNLIFDHVSLEQELLQCIQAVSLGPLEPNETIQVLSNNESTVITSELSSWNSCLSPSEQQPVVTDQPADLYADLVNSGASLSLEDSHGTIFDNQLLIDALKSAIEDIASPKIIDQLTRDLSQELLDGTSSFLDIGDLELVPLPSSVLNSQQTDTLHSSESGHETVDLKLLKTVLDGVSCGITDSEISKKRVKKEKCASDREGEESSPAKTRRQSSKKQQANGGFSVERFQDSDKDIEYYTGFQTHEKFNAFYRSIDSYVENLKVTDMMHGVANLGLNSSMQTRNEISPSPEATRTDNPSSDEPKRRLSQGRSLSRLDELFMTVVRLKRKIPEKVLGHMFCISQPSVSRIIRAWVMLLSRVLEIVHVEEKNSAPTRNVNLLETEVSEKSCLEITTEVEVPQGFRQLFQTDLAQSIIQSSGSTNHRKTSSTTFPSTSRSKRLKKEKNIDSAVESELECSTSKEDIVGTETFTLVQTEDTCSIPNVVDTCSSIPHTASTTILINGAGCEDS